MTAEAIKTVKLNRGQGRALGAGATPCYGAASIALAMAFLCLVASPVAALDHSGTIASNETWYAANNPHVIVTSVTVSDGVILTIEDGADVLFNSGTRLNVYGALTAIGSPGGGILFSRNTTSNGTGLRFLGDGTGTLDYCTVEYATYGVYANTTGTIAIANTTIESCSYGINAIDGAVQLTNTTIGDCTSYGFYGNGVAPTLLDENVVIETSATGMHLTDIPGLSLTSAVVVRDNTNIGIEILGCDTPTLDNLTLTGNGGTHGAVYLNNVGEFTLGSGNTIGGTGQENSWPVTITAGSYPSASSIIPTTGNTNNDIQVRGGTSDRTGVWRKFADLDYIVVINPSISAGGGLTIEDEVNVLFNSGVRLNVNGTLTAVGSPGGGILFSRSGASNGTGLRFLGDGTGTLDYCTVEYATYGVYTNSTGTIAIANTTIGPCSYGINAIDGAVQLTNTQIVNNTSYGVYLDGATPSFGSNEDEWNDIYGNGSGNAGRNLRNGPTDIDAQYVYWGAIDEPTIQYGIWDENDDLDLGLVNYTPWCTAAHDTTIVGVPGQEQPEELPKQFSLAPNYPNPFNPMTTIRFSLAAPAPVRLTIYDVSGALVTTLVDRNLPVGNYRITWRGLDRRGREVASGVYLYTIAAGDFHQTRRMMLIR